MAETWDIVIVGGGAAGLMAAIFAGRAAHEAGKAVRIGLLDGATRLGAKILVAGGGRCNVTHQTVSADDFAGGSRNAINRILRSFTVKETISFFEELGVRLKTESTGKLFPITDRAQTVLSALLAAVEDAGATIMTDCRVHGVNRDNDGFALDTSQGVMTARRLIMATGGKSLPKTGSDGAGLNFVRALGHTVKRTMPALVPLKLEAGHFITQLSGVSAEVELTVTQLSGKVINRMTGAMLCTHFGISGPVVLDISRYWVAARYEGDLPKMLVNFLPGKTFDELDRTLVDAGRRSPRTPVFQLFKGPLTERLAKRLVETQAMVHAGTVVGQLSREQRRSLVHGLIQLELPVIGDRGYKFAEVTAGGIALDEVDTATMASRKCDSLYLCGEILDADGRVGGFNFQWAWCTGRLAGIAAAKDLK